MKRYRIILSLILGVLLPFSMFGGGQAEDSTADGVVELRLAVPTDSLPPGDLDILLDEFHDRYPDIRVVDVIQITNDDWPDYFTQIRTLIAGGNPPDVVRLAIEGVQYMVGNNLALPLNEYFDMYPELRESLEDTHPQLQGAFEIDGNIYGTTWDWNNVVTHINLEMLEAVGLPFPEEDWDQDTFLEYAQALTREVDGQQVYGTVIPDYYFAVNAWLYNFDASFLTEDLTESALDTQEAYDAFRFMYDLVHTYEVAPEPDPGIGFIDRFIAEQVAMVFGGRWPVNNWLDNDMDFDIQYVPSFRTNQVIFGSGAWPVLSMSQNPEEAFLLSSFLGSEFSQREVLSVQSIPTRISLMDEVLPQSAPSNSRLYRESADISRAVQAPQAYPELGEIFARHFSAMMSGEVSVEDALSAMHRDFNEALGN